MSKLLCTKIREGAIVPSKRQSDAGYDMYGVFEDALVIHEPHTVKMFATGIKTAFDTGYVAFLKERGSTGTKGMEQRAGVIEGNYRGEWFVPILNGTDKSIFYIDTVKFTQEHFVKLVKYFTGEEYECLGQYSDSSYHYIGAGISIMIDVVDNIPKTVNVSCEDGLYKFTIYPQNKAITQIVIIKKEDWQVEEITEEELMSIESDRGEGALGSSGK